MLQAYGNPFVLRRARLYLKTHVVYAAQNPAMTYDLVVGCKTWSCSRGYRPGLSYLKYDLVVPF